MNIKCINTIYFPKIFLACYSTSMLIIIPTSRLISATDTPTTTPIPLTDTQTTRPNPQTEAPIDTDDVISNDEKEKRKIFLCLLGY